MATAVETLLTTIKAVQAALLVITGLQLTGYRYPQPATVENGATFDVIIVGAGSGGSVIANRLTELPNINVLLVEAGGDPPLESVLPGIFTLLPSSEVDYQYTSEDDGYTSQNLINQVIPATAGKMLGGSSSLSHMIHVRGNPHDYQLWAEASGDDRWNYDNMLQYLMRSEKLEDEEILNSDSARFLGTDGYLRIHRQKAPENEGIMAAFNEIGLPTAQNQLAPSFTLGIGEPFVNIGDGYRSQGADYLMPLEERPNFSILKSTQVTKILFDYSNKAIGVEALTATNETLTINARLQVVLSAGVFGTPKLLMLSGIGPREHLESLGIPVISDLPVGKDFQDHIPAVVVTALQAGEPVTAPPNPHLFPVPVTTGYHALDRNQAYPDYQTINLLFPPDNTAQIQICSLVFGYKNDICQQFFDGGAGRFTMLTVNNIMQTISRGEVLLRSADPAADPIIRHGIYTNETDLHNMALYLQDFARIYETEAFKSIGAQMVEMNLPECNDIERNTYEYWRCYALQMSGSMWAYTSTARMGTVLNSNLEVRGVQNLRVVDASAMPNSISGNINAGVVGLAERGADLIKASLGPSPRSSAAN